MSTKLSVSLVLGLLFLFILITLLNPFVLIPAGNKGVILNWGAVSSRVMDEGLHLRVPFQQQIVKIDVQTQKMEVQTYAYSKDIQTVQTKIALNYHVNPDVVQVLWKEVGKMFEERIIRPSIEESVKASTAEYSAQELIEKREMVKEKIKQMLTDRLKKYFLVDDFSIVDFSFNDEFEKAVEEKQVAQQKALKAENDLSRIQIEAKQKIETAKAEAEAIRIRGEALKENKQLVELEAVQRWNGILPQYMLGDTVPFLNLNK